MIANLEWGEVLPSHWAAVRLKQVCEVFPSNVDKKSYDGDAGVLLCNYTDVYYNDRITRDIQFMEATATAEQIARFGLRAGDTIITKDSETPDDIAIAAYVPEDLPGVVCGYHLAMVRPRRAADGAFIKWWFGSQSLKASVHVRANGLTRVGLGQFDLDNLVIALPPLTEQTAIATFLDRETGKIDALVEEQRRLIELLKEKRQAVISHAVTKGLDPNAKMKPSGVEWLGDVPEHWEVKRLRYLGEAIIGLTYAPDDVVDEGEGLLVLRSSNVQGGKIAFEDNVYVSVLPPERLVTQIGDILICARNGSRALIGKNAMIDEASMGMTFGAFMTIFRGPYNEYLRWVLSSSLFDAQAGAYMSTTINQLTTSTLNAMKVPLPPEGERATISARLGAAVERYDRLVGEAEAAIRLLHERRAALISAAVTGKIDVREFAEAGTAAA